MRESEYRRIVRFTVGMLGSDLPDAVLIGRAHDNLVALLKLVPATALEADPPVVRRVEAFPAAARR